MSYILETPQYLTSCLLFAIFFPIEICSRCLKFKAIKIYIARWILGSYVLSVINDIVMSPLTHYFPSQLSCDCVKTAQLVQIPQPSNTPGLHQEQSKEIFWLCQGFILGVIIFNCLSSRWRILAIPMRRDPCLWWKYVLASVGLSPFIG